MAGRLLGMLASSAGPAGRFSPIGPSASSDTVREKNGAGLGLAGGGRLRGSTGCRGGPLLPPKAGTNSVRRVSAG